MCGERQRGASATFPGHLSFEKKNRIYTNQFCIININSAATFLKILSRLSNSRR